VSVKTSNEIIEINQHNLYVETHGSVSGPVVILLHHGLGTTLSWRGQVPALIEAGYRVIAYDRWGYGKSQSRSSLHLPEFTPDRQDLLSLLDIKGVSKACLVGHSDGGTIGLYFAAEHPERVACLVVVAAHIYVEPKMIPGLQSIAESSKNDLHFIKGLQRAHGDKVDAVFNNWHGGWNQSNHVGWDMRSVIKSIKCPTLVVQGTEDEHATDQHARDIAVNIANAELWLAPQARHMLPQENSELFNQRLLAFMADHIYNKRTVY
jgi:pimeloyl-ACP methyl ester carboxylesterase